MEETQPNRWDVLLLKVHPHIFQGWQEFSSLLTHISFATGHCQVKQSKVFGVRSLPGLSILSMPLLCRQKSKDKEKGDLMVQGCGFCDPAQPVFLLTQEIAFIANHLTLRSWLG